MKEYIPAPDGAFKIVGLPPDVYDLMISYSFSNGEEMKTYYLEIFRVPVKEDEATLLGLINLPVILR